jgi:hypothetical protein
MELICKSIAFKTYALGGLTWPSNTFNSVRTLRVSERLAYRVLDACSKCEVLGTMLRTSAC